MTTAKTLRSFVLEHTVGDDSRVPAVLGRDSTDTVTPDRTLRDAALALIALAPLEDATVVTGLLKGLAEFEDPDADGYHELLDITGAPHPIGLVRTPGAQALALSGRHRAAVTLGDPDLAEDSASRLRTLLARSAAQEWPALLTPSGAVLDSASSLADTAELTLAVCELPTDVAWDGVLDQVAAHLERFHTDTGALAFLTPRGAPDTRYGHRLRATALAASAWAALAERGHAQAAEHAARLLRHARDSHQHTTGRGFWDRAGGDSQVRVDPVIAVHGRPDSPFPAKLTADAALLAVAAQRVAQLTGEPEFTALADAARSELHRYSDLAVGGVFQGQGSWFSTPVDPTVPLARHVMVPPRSAGAFSVGNTAYVPFHEKHAETQFLALLALGNQAPPVPAAPPRPAGLAHWPVEPDLSHAAKAPLSDSAIDLDRYLAWLRSTESGLGYGLTPYRAPLGLRSDRTAQTFSALHVVSDLLTVGEPVPDAEGLLRGIYSTQNPDGGFGEQPGLLSEAFTTYCAVLTAKVLGGADYAQKACASFLHACQHAEGGYGNAPGYPPDAWHSNLAVLALHALGERPAREDDLVGYLTACRNPDGGYGNQPGAPSDAFATFRATDTLAALGVRPVDLDATVSWVQALQTPSGGFRYRENGAESFVGSYHVIATLYVAGAQPLDAAACRQWIADRQTADGGFSRLPGGPSETTDEGFIAIQALHMLEGKLNRYWAVIMT